MCNCQKLGFARCVLQQHPWQEPHKLRRLLRRPPSIIVVVFISNTISLTEALRPLDANFPQNVISPHISQNICDFECDDIKVGTIIEVDELVRVKQGRTGPAFVRTKLKNYIKGSTIEQTFRAGITVEEAEVTKEMKQFTYKDGAQLVFKVLRTNEEYRPDEKDLAIR